MNVGNSVRKAIDDWEINEFDASMLHACNAIDGTARKAYRELGNNARFTRLLRENYSILGPMGFPGINLIETRFPVKGDHPKAPGGKPDLADVIYSIHRCSHGHGDELPDGFALIPDVCGEPSHTRVKVQRRAIQLSDRVIFGLIAVAVMCPFNKDQSVPGGYYLTFGRSTEKLMINDWWGRAADFPAIAAKEPMPLVTLDFIDWMEDL